jgi:cytochrome c-type biogenesis protein
LGAAFAFGWTPCIGPVLGAVLTFTAVSSDSMAQGALNLGVYALGIGAPLFVVALAADVGQRLVKGLKRFIPALEKTAGAMLIAMSILMVTDNTTMLTFGLGEDDTAAISAPLVAGANTGVSGRMVVRAPKAAAAHAATEAAAAAACSAETTACGLGEADGSGGRADVIPPGPVLVDFYRPNCPACLKMVPVIDALESTCTAKGLSIARIDVSRTENRALAAEMGVVGTPTLVFIQPDGSEAARLVGSTDLTTVERAVAVLMGEACTDFGRL